MDQRPNNYNDQGPNGQGPNGNGGPGGPKNKSSWRLRVSNMEIITSAAIMIQVTTTDSAISIPPNRGIVKAVSQFSSSSNLLAKSVSLPPFP